MSSSTEDSKNGGGGASGAGDGGPNMGAANPTSKLLSSEGGQAEPEEVVGELLLGAVTTYLRPLLDKHASSRPTLAFEDLTASWHAAEKFLQPHSSSEKGKDDEEYHAALKRVTELHKGQVSAYRDAAITGLREFAAAKFALPAVDEFLASVAKGADGGAAAVGSGSSRSAATKESYVQHACELAMEQRPNWRVGTGILAKVVAATVKQRAGEAYEAHKKAEAFGKAAIAAATSKSPPSSSGVEVASGNDVTSKKDDNEPVESGDGDEEGEVHEEDDETVEDGQMDEDESHGEVAEDAAGSEAANEATPTAAISNAKKKGGTKRKAPGGKNPKAAVIRKKVGGGKAVAQARAAAASAGSAGPAGRGNARRGRGGSSAAAAATAPAK